MQSVALETYAFDNEIKHYYEAKEFGKIKESIETLIRDSLDIDIELIIHRVARFNDKYLFLEWVYSVYPEYKEYINNNT